jgi:6-phosphogluconolactonase
VADPLTSLRIVDDAAALAVAAAEELTRRAEEAVRARGRFTLALSGGSTPRALYRLLADPGAPFRDRIDWRAVHVFWGDERCVPPDHAESNYRMAREALLDRVPLPAEHVHRMRGEEPDAARAAAQYEAELAGVLALAPGALPRFDLILLGLGPDGHTASLFPGSAVVHERARWVAAPFVPKFNAFRITLTPPVLNHAAAVMFVVSGAEKAAALAAILRDGLREDSPVDLYPARIVRPEDGELLWLVDRAAAERLEQS